MNILYIAIIFFIYYVYSSNKFTNSFFYSFISNIHYQQTNQDQNTILTMGKIIDLNLHIFVFNIHKHKIQFIISFFFCLVSFSNVSF